MAQWMDRYEKHPIHAQIQSAEQLISASEVFIGEVKDPNGYPDEFGHSIQGNLAGHSD